MDLRDQFAVHFAATLAGALTDAAQVARRAYDFADAMLAERAQRLDADEARAIGADLPFGAIEPEFIPDELDEEAIEEPYDPSWDVEPRWQAEPAPDTTRGGLLEFEALRPGLARTQPPEAETKVVGA